MPSPFSGSTQEEGEVGEHVQEVIGGIALEGDHLVLGGLPQEIAVEVEALGGAALAVVDGPEAVDQALVHGAQGNLARGEPVAVEIGADDAQREVLAQRRRGLGEDVDAPVVLRAIEGPVGGVELTGEERLQGAARRREQREVALGVERPAPRLGEVLVHHVEGDEVDGRRRVEVAVLRVVRPLEDVDPGQGLGDDEVQIGVALPVGVAPEVHGQAVGEEGDVGAVVAVESAQEVLVGLAPAVVLRDHEAGDQAQDVRGPALGPELEALAGDEDLRGGRQGGRGLHHHGGQDGLRRRQGLLLARGLGGAARAMARARSTAPKQTRRPPRETGSGRADRRGSHARPPARRMLRIGME